MRRYYGTPLIRLVLGLLVAASSVSCQVTSYTPARFAVIGDFGYGLSEHEGAVASLVHGWNPDFIITLGDNRYGMIDYDSAVGKYYCDFLAEAEPGSYCSGNNAPSNAFFPSLGNHDYKDGCGLGEYLSYFTLPGSGVDTSGTSGSERYYDFTRGPVHFFVVDSKGALRSKDDCAAQMTWLQEQLAGTTRPWKIVYFHHPPYSSGKHGSTTRMQWPFALWGADAVISGHDHNYERLSVEGINFFVNGLGGRSIRDFTDPVTGSLVRYNDDFGAMLVNADEDVVTFKFFNVTGEVIDIFTIGTMPAQ